MERIIALYASSNSGKTETLNLLAKKLQDAGLKLLDKQPYEYNEKDFFYTLKKGRKTIGIFTGGDDGDIVDGAVQYFEENECDIVICATRTKGSSCLRLEKFAKKHKVKIEWADKLSIPKSLLAEMNSSDANQLFTAVSGDLKLWNED